MNQHKKDEVTVYLHEPIDHCYEYIVMGEWKDIKYQLDHLNIKDYQVVCNHKNSRMDLYDYKDLDIRVEPGAIIREGVTLHPGCIILMGAILNTGCVIKRGTMVDMGCVIGSGAIIGQMCHIGANAVIAGIMEPQSESPVIIEDHVMIGANSVILSGVHIYSNSVIGAGSVVLEDIPSNCVYAGNPARFIKYVDEKTESKTKINQNLRK